MGSTHFYQHTNIKSHQITIGIPQGLLLVPLLFSIVTNDLSNGTDCTINRFLDRKPNWRGLVDTLEHRAGVLDNNRLKKWTDGKFTKFNPWHVPSAASGME